MTPTDRILQAVSDRALYPSEERNSRLRADVDKVLEEMNIAANSPGLVDRARETCTNCLTAYDSCECAVSTNSTHTIDCRFQHFLSYTGYGELSVDEVVRLRIAYEHGVGRGA